MQKLRLNKILSSTRSYPSATSQSGDGYRSRPGGTLWKALVFGMGLSFSLHVNGQAVNDNQSEPYSNRAVLGNTTVEANRKANGSGHKQSQETEIVLLGDSRTFSSSGRVWVENGNVLDAKAEGGGVRVFAKGEGRSDIVLGQRRISVQVLRLSMLRGAEQLPILIKKTLGLRSEIRNGNFEVHGRLQRWEDWLTLRNHCQKMECSYHLMANMDESLRQRALDNLHQQLKSMQLPGLLVQTRKGWRITLSPDHPQFQELIQALEPWGIQIVREKNLVDQNPLVRVQIDVAEIKRSKVRSIGIDWQNFYSAQLLPKVEGGTYEVMLQSLEQKGEGRILASPNLLSRSGSEAEFLAGGEFPIKIVHLGSRDVVWKRYGILLKVLPTADRTGAVSLSLTTEISSIDDSRTVDGVPGIVSNKVQSHFNVKQSQTIALSGLIQNSSGASLRGLPGLADLPILGSLFRSTDFRENQSELVIFVRPEILDLDSQPEPVQPPKALRAENFPDGQFQNTPPTGSR